MTETEATKRVRWIAILAALMEPGAAKKVRLVAISLPSGSSCSSTALADRHVVSAVVKAERRDRTVWLWRYVWLPLIVTLAIVTLIMLAALGWIPKQAALNILFNA